MDARLNDVLLTPETNNPAIKITKPEYTKNETLKPGSSQNLQIKIEYDSNYTGEVDYNTSTEAEVTLNNIQGNG